MANVIVSIIASAVIGSYQQRKAKQRAAAARRRALEAQREAAAIEARTSNTNQPIPVIYGRAGTPGLAVYSQVGKIWQNNAPANATDRRISGDSGFEIDEAEEKNTVLLRQFVISIGELKKITYALIDGEPFDAGKYDNAQDIKWAFGDSDLVISNGMSQIGAEERKPADVRFTGLTFATAGFYLDLDDPKYRGFPELFFYCEGIDTKYITRTENAYNIRNPDEDEFPYINKRSNPALILYDYLTRSDFGPNLSDAAIDKASFALTSALCADPICHLGFQEWNIGRRYDPIIWSGRFLPLYNNFWTRAFPTRRNAFSGMSFESYRQYLTEYTSILPSNNQFDGLLPEDEANRFGSVNFVLNRYEFNGAVSTTRKFFDAISVILETMPGAQFFRSISGKWKIAIPDPLMSLSNIPTFDEFDEDFEEVRPDADDLVNRITIRFSDIEKDYAGGVIEFPMPGSPLDRQLQSADGGVFRLSLDVVGCNNKLHAIAIAANTILIRRREVYRFTVSKKYLLYEQGDVIRILRERLPALDVYAIITHKRPNPDLSITFTARRFSRADYDLYLTDQERIPISAEVPANPFVPYSDTVPTYLPPTGFPAAGIPGQPGKPVLRDRSDSYIAVQWTFPVSGGRVDTVLTSDYHEVQISRSSSFSSPTTKTTNDDLVSFSGLSSNTAYYIRVRARNVIGFGEYSATLTVQTTAAPVIPSRPGVPGTPMLVSKTHSTISLDWTAPTSGGAFNPSLSTDHYEIEIDTVSDFSSEQRLFGQVDQPSVVYAQLQPSTTYYVRIRAFNQGGFSDYSGTLSVTTNAGISLVPGKPGTPTGTRTERRGLADLLNISWEAPTTGGPFNPSLFGNYYEVRIEVSGSDPTTDGQYRTHTTSSESYEGVAGLSHSSVNNLLVRVRAHNTDGSGPWSDTLTLAGRL